MACPERRCANPQCSNLLHPGDEIFRSEYGLLCLMCSTDYLLSKDPELYDELDRDGRLDMGDLDDFIIETEEDENDD